MLGIEGQGHRAAARHDILPATRPQGDGAATAAMVRHRRHATLGAPDEARYAPPISTTPFATDIAMTDDHSARAAELSLALQAFHRALLHAEIGGDPAYDSPYTKLFALIGEPRFAWMKGVPELIARIDEHRNDATIAGPGVLEGLREEARAFLGEGRLKPDGTFRLRHLTAIQKEPDVGLATGRLRRVLAGRA